jgi:hypothetical protein
MKLTVNWQWLHVNSNTMFTFKLNCYKFAKGNLELDSYSWTKLPFFRDVFESYLPCIVTMTNPASKDPFRTQ